MDKQKKQVKNTRYHFAITEEEKRELIEYVSKLPYPVTVPMFIRHVIFEKIRASE